MKSIYQCTICKEDDKYNSFKTKGAIESHIMERHTTFSWQCIYCQVVTTRENGRHARCSRGDRPVKSECFDRSNGNVGEPAKSAYLKHKKEFTPDKMVEKKIEGDLDTNKKGSRSWSPKRSPKRQCNSAEKRRHTITSTVTKPSSTLSKPNIVVVVDQTERVIEESNQVESKRSEEDTESDQSDHDHDDE